MVENMGWRTLWKWVWNLQLFGSTVWSKKELLRLIIFFFPPGRCTNTERAQQEKAGTLLWTRRPIMSKEFGFACVISEKTMISDRNIRMQFRVLTLNFSVIVWRAEPHYGWADVVGNSTQLLSIQPRERPPGVFPNLDFGSIPSPPPEEESGDPPPQ